MSENVAYCHSIRNSHPFKLELVSFSFSFLLSIVTFLFDLAPFHLPHLHIYYSSSSSSVLNVFFRRKEKKNWLHDTRNNKETGLPIKLFYSLYFIRTLSSSLLRFLFLEKSYIFGPVSLSQLFFFSLVTLTRFLDPSSSGNEKTEKEKGEENSPIRYLSKIHRTDPLLDPLSFSRRNNCRARTRTVEPCPRNKRAGVI